MASEPAIPSLPSPSELLTSIINQLSTLEPAQPPADPKPAGPASSLSRHAASWYNNTQTNTTTDADNPLISLLPTETIPQAKSLLLTLHFLFPNELLLALDILDRKLVRRCCVQSHQHRLQRPLPNSRGRRVVYFVRSSQSGPSATGARDLVVRRSYEVHLDSWNCTCTAFTLAMIRSLDLADRDEHHQVSEMAVPEREIIDWRFGGSLTKKMSAGQTTATTGPPTTGYVRTPPPPACCKHLLACVLAARCPRLFGGGVEEVDVDLDDATSAGRGKICEFAAWHSGW